MYKAKQLAIRKTKISACATEFKYVDNRNYAEYILPPMPYQDKMDPFVQSWHVEMVVLLSNEKKKAYHVEIEM